MSVGVGRSPTLTAASRAAAVTWAGVPQRLFLGLDVAPQPPCAPAPWLCLGWSGPLTQLESFHEVCKD